MLAGLGLVVRVERRTQDAVLKLVAGEIPDLVLIKLEQKDMPTRTACLGMRGTPGMRRTPLLVYSAAPQEEAAARVKRCGAHGLLSVPFSPSRVVQWLQSNRDYFGAEVLVPELPEGAALSPRQVVKALDPQLDPADWTGEELTPAPLSAVGSAPPGLRGGIVDTEPVGVPLAPRKEDEVAALEAAIRAAAEEELSEISGIHSEVCSEVQAGAASPPAGPEPLDIDELPDLDDLPDLDPLPDPVPLVGHSPPGRVVPTSPAVAPPPGVSAPVPAAAPRHTLEAGGPIPVLLVDDEELVLEMLGDFLEEDGYRILKARDIGEFRRAIATTCFGVIVLDVRLTDAGGGDKIAEYVNQFMEAPKPRIYLHSGLPEEELKMLALRLRVDGYLCKGCGEGAVREAVARGATAFAEEWLKLEEAGWQ